MAFINITGIAIVDSNPNTIPELQEKHKIKKAILEDGSREWRFNSSLSNGQKWIELNTPSTDLIYIKNYSDIPEKPGLYSVSPQSLSNIETSILDLEKNRRLTASEIGADIGSNYIIRTKSALTGQAGIIFGFFNDALYSYKGDRIGDINTFVFGGRLKVNLEDSQNIMPPNTISISDENQDEHNYVRIKFKVTDDLKINDYIKTPFDLPIQQSSGWKIIESYVSINDKKINNFNAGILTHEAGKPAPFVIQDLDCSFCELKNVSHVEIKLKIKNSPTDASPFISNVSKINYQGKNVFNLDGEEFHSINMDRTFNEVYDASKGFTSEILNSFKNPISAKAILDRENTAFGTIDSDVDLLFSAGNGMGFLRSPLRLFSDDALKVVAHGSNDPSERFDQTDSIDDFLHNGVMVSSRALDDNDGSDVLGTSYGFGVEFSEPTRTEDFIARGWTPWGGGEKHQQSPATAVVAAKMKWIKDRSNAPWHIVRKACRLTADNANNYNIYRGFGQINRLFALLWISDNYSNTISKNLANKYELNSPYSNLVEFEDKSLNTAVTKNDLIKNDIPVTRLEINTSVIQGSSLQYKVDRGRLIINGFFTAKFRGSQNIGNLPEGAKVNTTRTSSSLFENANTEAKPVYLYQDGRINAVLEENTSYFLDIDITLKF